MVHFYNEDGENHTLDKAILKLKHGWIWTQGQQVKNKLKCGHRAESYSPRAHVPVSTETGSACTGERPCQDIPCPHGPWFTEGKPVAGLLSLPCGRQGLSPASWLQCWPTLGRQGTSVKWVSRWKLSTSVSLPLKGQKSTNSFFYDIALQTLWRPLICMNFKTTVLKSPYLLILFFHELKSLQNVSGELDN